MNHDDSRDWFPVLISVAVIIYGTIYSVYAYLRYISFNSYVFDLGVSSQLLYGVLHGSGITLANLVPNKLIYIPMGIIYGIHPYPPSLEYFQAFWLAAGSLPLYFISRIRMGSRHIAAALSLSYLLFYPLGGVYWFDFHFMALFPTFILLSIYSRESGHSRWAFATALLAGLTDFMAPLIMLFFGIFILVDDRRRKGERMGGNYLGIALIASGLAIFSIVVAYYGYSYFVTYASGSITVPAPFSQNSPLTYREQFFFWMFLPVLFISFFAPDALLLMIPYAAFALANQYTPYVSTMYYQYPALTSPIIFYSLVIGLQRIKGIKIGKVRNLSKEVAGIAYSILAVNLVLALLFTPAGNGLLNPNLPVGFEYNLTGQHGNYYTDNLIQVHPYDSNISQMISLIPEGSRILIQNNMAQMTSRYNWSLPYMINISSGNLPEYVFVDPYNRAFYTTYFTNNYHDNMAYYVRSFLSSQKYGIYASEDGIMILKKGYAEPPVKYEPAWLPLFSGTLLKQSGNISWSRPGLIYNNDSFIPGGNSSLAVAVNGDRGNGFEPLFVSVGWRYSNYSPEHYLNFTSPSETMSLNGSTIFMYSLESAGGPVPIFSYNVGYYQPGSLSSNVSVSVLQTSP